MIIRPFNASDIDTLIQMGRRVHQESEYRGLGYSEARLKQLADNILSGSSLFGMVAINKGWNIVGVLIAGVTPTWFSDDLVASDLLIYVLPEYRGTLAFYKLCLAYRAMARKKGARLIFLRNTTGYNPEKVGELYKRMGFEQIGGIYRLEE